MPRARFDFPAGKRFAFTIVDDTDVGTVANLGPLYDLLHTLGMHTTKTVWPLACPEGSPNFADSETLADPAYREWVLGLRRRGFEITWHGATMESSERARTLAGLDRYKDVFDAYPRIHVNHSHNRENMYWGSGRFDAMLPRMMMARLAGRPASYFTGHVEGSPYWWGDACAQHFTYGRNLTTNDIDTAAFNPSMPYRDPARPLIPWWFSASDAESVTEFNALLSSANQERLERTGGICLVATHFGKGFVENGAVHPETQARLEELGRRNGWFTSVGTLLDWLRARREATPGDTGALPRREWNRMQRQWAIEIAARKLRLKFRGGSPGM